MCIKCLNGESKYIKKCMNKNTKHDHKISAWNIRDTLIIRLCINGYIKLLSNRKTRKNKRVLFVNSLIDIIPFVRSVHTYIDPNTRAYYSLSSNTVHIYLYKYKKCFNSLFVSSPKIYRLFSKHTSKTNTLAACILIVFDYTKLWCL